MEAIEIAAKRGASLTHQLLSFSRRQSLNPAVVELAAIVEKVVRSCRACLAMGSNVSTMILPDIWPVQVDPSELNWRSSI